MSQINFIQPGMGTTSQYETILHIALLKPLEHGCNVCIDFSTEFTLIFTAKSLQLAGTVQIEY